MIVAFFHSLCRPSVTNITLWTIWVHAGLLTSAVWMDAWGWLEWNSTISRRPAIPEIVVVVEQPIEKPRFFGSTRVAQIQMPQIAAESNPTPRHVESAVEPTVVEPNPPEFEVDAADAESAESPSPSATAVVKQQAQVVVAELMPLANVAPRPAPTDARPPTAKPRRSEAARFQPPPDQPTRPVRVARRAAEHVQPPIAASSVPQFAGTDESTPPDFTTGRAPEYPLEAFQRGIEGDVLLRLFIAATGEVERVEVEKSSGWAILDQAAASAVRTWRGAPARQGGRPVATVEFLPVRFRLKADSSR